MQGGAGDKRAQLLLGEALQAPLPALRLPLQYCLGPGSTIDTLESSSHVERTILGS